MIILLLHNPLFVKKYLFLKSKIVTCELFTLSALKLFLYLKNQIYLFKSVIIVLSILKSVQ